MITSTPSDLEAGQRLQQLVLAPLKASFVGKDEIIDLMGLCLVSGENLFILGPPGTAKSALVHHLGLRLQGITFEYLLTRFTEPNELFGPFDIRKLRDGTLETNTEGMLPEADLIFLDELLNANSAILNSLLTVLNERKLRRGREILDLPVLMTVGASNHLPEDEALRALFDRFLLRVVSDNVSDDHLAEVLQAGWRLQSTEAQSPQSSLSAQDIRQLRALLPQVSLQDITPTYLTLIKRLRSIGIEISDRRAVKLQRLIAASALLCDRMTAITSDLWILEHIWDREEQRELLRSVVRETIHPEEGQDQDPQQTETHPQAQSQSPPDPEQLLSALTQLQLEASSPDAEHQLTNLRDRLRALQNQSEWITNEEQRETLRQTIETTWTQLEEPAVS